MTAENSPISKAIQKINTTNEYLTAGNPLEAHHIHMWLIIKPLWDTYSTHSLLSIIPVYTVPNGALYKSFINVYHHPMGLNSSPCQIPLQNKIGTLYILGHCQTCGSERYTTFRRLALSQFVGQNSSFCLWQRHNQRPKRRTYFWNNG
jgi:hypothetical protein